MQHELIQLIEKYGAEKFLIEVENLLNTHEQTKRFSQQEQWVILALQKNYNPDEIINVNITLLEGACNGN